MYLNSFKNQISNIKSYLSVRAYRWSDCSLGSNIIRVTTNCFTVIFSNWAKGSQTSTSRIELSALNYFWADIVCKNVNVRQGNYDSAVKNTKYLTDKNKFLISGQTKIGNPLKELQLSPWPVLLSIFLLNAALIIVGLFNGIAYKNIYLLFSLLLVIFSMISWLLDLSREGSFLGNHITIVKSSLYYGLGLFIVSEIMFFFSLFWTFFNSILSGSVWVGCSWPPVGLNTYLQSVGLELAIVNTCILLFSGYTLTLAHEFYIYKNKFLSIYFLTATILLGIFFMFVQVFEFKNSLYCFNDSIYSSVFFFLTGFHGLHVVLGIKGLIFSIYRSIMDYTRADQHLGFEAAIWYWHFVDVVWLFVFCLIYIWGNASTGQNDLIYYSVGNRVILAAALCSVFLFLFFYPINYIKVFISSYKIGTLGVRTPIYFFLKSLFTRFIGFVKVIFTRNADPTDFRRMSILKADTRSNLRENSTTVVFFVMLFSLFITADLPVVDPISQFKLQDGATLVSFASKHFFLSMYILTVFVVSFVLFITLLFVYAHEEQVNNKKFVEAPQKTHNTFLETIWTTLPSGTISTLAASSFILLFISDVGNSFRFYGDLISNKFPSALRTRVTGSQWFWTYNYDLPKFTELAEATSKVSRALEQVMRAVSSILPGEHRLLSTGDNLVLPTFTLLRFYITSTDVIHSFALPSMYIKLDACPGRLNLLSTVVTRIGAFYGQCSEICGINHSFMPISTEIVDSKNFWSGVTNFIAAQYYAFLSKSFSYNKQGTLSILDAVECGLVRFAGDKVKEAIEYVASYTTETFFSSEKAKIRADYNFSRLLASKLKELVSGNEENETNYILNAADINKSVDDDIMIIPAYERRAIKQSNSSSNTSDEVFINPSRTLVLGKFVWLEQPIERQRTYANVISSPSILESWWGGIYDQKNQNYGTDKLARQRIAYVLKYGDDGYDPRLNWDESLKEDADFVGNTHWLLSPNTLSRLFGLTNKDNYPTYDFAKYFEEDLKNTGVKSISDYSIMSTIGTTIGLHHRSGVLSGNAKPQMINNNIYLVEGLDNRLNSYLEIASESHKTNFFTGTVHEWIFGISRGSEEILMNWRDVVYGGTKIPNYWSNLSSYFKITENDIMILADEYKRIRSFFDAMEYFNRHKIINPNFTIRRLRNLTIEPKLIDFLGKRSFYNPFAYYTPTPEDFTGNFATWVLPKSHGYMLHFKLFLEHKPEFLKFQLSFQKLISEFLILFAKYTEDNTSYPGIIKYELIEKSTTEKFVNFFAAIVSLEIQPTYREILPVPIDAWYDYFCFRPYLDSNFEIVAASPKIYSGFFSTEHINSDLVATPVVTFNLNSDGIPQSWDWNVTVVDQFPENLLLHVFNFFKEYYSTLLQRINNYETESATYEEEINSNSNSLIENNRDYFIVANPDEVPNAPYMYWRCGRFWPHQLFDIFSLEDLFLDFTITYQLLFDRSSSPFITFYKNNIFWLFERPDNSCVKKSLLPKDSSQERWAISTHISKFLDYCQEYKDSYLYVTYHSVAYDAYYYWRAVPRDIDNIGGGHAEPFEFFLNSEELKSIQPAGVVFISKTARSELYTLFDIYVNNNSNLSWTQRLVEYVYGSYFPAHLLYQTRHGVSKVFILDIFKTNLEVRNELLGVKRTVSFQEPTQQYKGFPKDQFLYRKALLSFKTSRAHSSIKVGSAARRFEIGYFRTVNHIKYVLNKVIFKKLFSGWVFNHLIDKSAFWVWEHCGFGSYYKYNNKVLHIKGEVCWFIYTNFFPAFLQKSYLNKFLNARTTSYKNAYPVLSTRLYGDHKQAAAVKKGSWNYGGNLWYSRKYNKSYYFVDLFNYKNYKQVLGVNVSKKLPSTIINRNRSVRFLKDDKKRAFLRLVSLGSDRQVMRKYRELELAHVSIECPRCNKANRYFTVEEEKPHYKKSLPTYNNYTVGERRWNEQFTPAPNTLYKVTHITDLDGFILDRVFWFDCQEKKCFTSIKVTASEISSIIQHANINRTATWSWIASCIGHNVYEPLLRADGTRFFFEHGFSEAAKRTEFSSKDLSPEAEPKKRHSWDDGEIGPVEVDAQRKLGRLLHDQIDLLTVRDHSSAKKAFKKKAVQYSFTLNKAKNLQMWSWPAFIAYYPPIEDYLETSYAYNRGVPAHASRALGSYLHNDEAATLLRRYGSGLHHATKIFSNKKGADLPETAEHSSGTMIQNQNLATSELAGVSYNLIASNSLGIMSNIVNPIKPSQLPTNSNKLTVQKIRRFCAPEYFTELASEQAGVVSPSVAQEHLITGNIVSSVQSTLLAVYPQDLSIAIGATNQKEDRYSAGDLSLVDRVGVNKFSKELSSGCLDYVLDSQNYKDIVYNNLRYNRYFNNSVWLYLFSKNELTDKESSYILNGAVDDAINHLRTFPMQTKSLVPSYSKMHKASLQYTDKYFLNTTILLYDLNREQQIANLPRRRRNDVDTESEAIGRSLFIKGTIADFVKRKKQDKFDIAFINTAFADNLSYVYSYGGISPDYVKSLYRSKGEALSLELSAVGNTALPIGLYLLEDDILSSFYKMYLPGFSSSLLDGEENTVTDFSKLYNSANPVHTLHSLQLDIVDRGGSLPYAYISPASVALSLRDVPAEVLQLGVDYIFMVQELRDVLQEHSSVARITGITKSYPNSALDYYKNLNNNFINKKSSALTRQRKDEEYTTLSEPIGTLDPYAASVFAYYENLNSNFVNKKTLNTYRQLFANKDLDNETNFKKLNNIYPTGLPSELVDGRGYTFTEDTSFSDIYNTSSAGNTEFGSTLNTLFEITGVDADTLANLSSSGSYRLSDIAKIPATPLSVGLTPYSVIRYGFSAQLYTSLDLIKHENNEKSIGVGGGGSSEVFFRTAEETLVEPHSTDVGRQLNKACATNNRGPRSIKGEDWGYLVKYSSYNTPSGVKLSTLVGDHFLDALHLEFPGLQTRQGSAAMEDILTSEKSVFNLTAQAALFSSEKYTVNMDRFPHGYNIRKIAGVDPLREQYTRSIYPDTQLSTYPFNSMIPLSNRIPNYNPSSKIVYAPNSEEFRSFYNSKLLLTDSIDFINKKISDGETRSSLTTKVEHLRTSIPFNSFITTSISRAKRVTDTYDNDVLKPMLDAYATLSVQSRLDSIGAIDTDMWRNKYLELYKNLKKDKEKSSTFSLLFNTSLVKRYPFRKGTSNEPVYTAQPVVEYNNSGQSLRNKKGFIFNILPSIEKPSMHSLDTIITNKLFYEGPYSSSVIFNSIAGSHTPQVSLPAPLLENFLRMKEFKRIHNNSKAFDNLQKFDMPTMSNEFGILDTRFLAGNYHGQIFNNLQYDYTKDLLNGISGRKAHSVLNTMGMRFLVSSPFYPMPTVNRNIVRSWTNSSIIPKNFKHYNENTYTKVILSKIESLPVSYGANNFGLYFGDSSIYDFTGDQGKQSSITQLNSSISNSVYNEFRVVASSKLHSIYGEKERILLSPFITKNYKLYGLSLDNMAPFDVMSRLYSFSDISNDESRNINDINGFNSKDFSVFKDLVLLKTKDLRDSYTSSSEEIAFVDYLRNTANNPQTNHYARYTTRYAPERSKAVSNIIDNYNPYSLGYRILYKDKLDSTSSDVVIPHYHKSLVEPLLETTLFDPKKAVAPFAPIFNKSLYKNCAPYLWYDYDKMVASYTEKKKKIISDIFKKNSPVFNVTGNVDATSTILKKKSMLIKGPTLVTEMPDVAIAVSRIKPWVNALIELDKLHRKFEVSYLEKQGLRGPRDSVKKIKDDTSIFVSTVENTGEDYQRACENSSRLVVQAFLSTLVLGDKDKNSGLFFNDNYYSWSSRADSTLDAHLSNMAIALNLKQVLSPENITYQDINTRNILAPAFIDATDSGKEYFVLIDWYLKTVNKEKNTIFFDESDIDSYEHDLVDLPEPTSVRNINSSAKEVINYLICSMKFDDKVLISNCLKAVANLAAYEHMLLTKDFVCILSLLKQIMSLDSIELCQYTYKNSSTGSTCKLAVDASSSASGFCGLEYTADKELLLLNVDLQGIHTQNILTSNKPIVTLLKKNISLNGCGSYADTWFSSKIEISMKPEDARNYINHARHSNNLLTNPSKLINSLTRRFSSQENAISLVSNLRSSILFIGSKEQPNLSTPGISRKDIYENFFSTENLHVLDCINPISSSHSFIDALLLTLYLNNHKTSFVTAHSSLHHQLIANNPLFNSAEYLDNIDNQFTNSHSLGQFINFAGFLCFGSDWSQLAQCKDDIFNLTVLSEDNAELEEEEAPVFPEYLDLFIDDEKEFDKFLAGYDSPDTRKHMYNIEDVVEGMDFGVDIEELDEEFSDGALEHKEEILESKKWYEEPIQEEDEEVGPWGHYEEEDGVAGSWGYYEEAEEERLYPQQSSVLTGDYEPDMQVDAEVPYSLLSEIYKKLEPNKPEKPIVPYAVPVGADLDEELASALSAKKVTQLEGESHLAYVLRRLAEEELVAKKIDIIKKKIKEREDLALRRIKAAEAEALLVEKAAKAIRKAMPATKNITAERLELFKQLMRLYGVQYYNDSDNSAFDFIKKGSGVSAVYTRFKDFSCFIRKDPKALNLYLDVVSNLEEVPVSNYFMKELINSYLSDFSTSVTGDALKNNLVLALSSVFSSSNGLGKFEPFMSSWNYVFISNLVEKYHLDTVDLNSSYNAPYMRSILDCNFLKTRMEYNGFTLFPFADSATPFPISKKNSPFVNMFISPFDGDTFDIGNRELVQDFIFKNDHSTITSKYRMQSAISAARQDSNIFGAQRLIKRVLASGKFDKDYYLKVTGFTPQVKRMVDTWIAHNIIIDKRPLLDAGVWGSTAVTSFRMRLLGRYDYSSLRSKQLQLSHPSFYKGMSTDVNSSEFRNRMSRLSKNYFNNYVLGSRLLDSSKTNGRTSFLLLNDISGLLQNRIRKQSAGGSNSNMLLRGPQGNLVIQEPKVVGTNTQTNLFNDTSKKYILDKRQLYKNIRSLVTNGNKSARYLYRVRKHLSLYREQNLPVYDSWMEAYISKIYDTPTAVAAGNEYVYNFGGVENRESAVMNNQVPSWLNSYLKVEAIKTNPAAIKAEVDLVFYNNPDTEANLIEQIVSSSRRYELTSVGRINSTISLARGLDSLVLKKEQTVGQTIKLAILDVLVPKNFQNVPAIKISNDIYVLPKLEYATKLQGQVNTIVRSLKRDVTSATPLSIEGITEETIKLVQFIQFIQPGFKKAFDPEFVPSVVNFDPNYKSVAIPTQLPIAPHYKVRAVHGDDQLSGLDYPKGIDAHTGIHRKDVVENLNSDEYGSYVQNKVNYVDRYIYVDRNGIYIKEVSKKDLKADLLSASINPEFCAFSVDKSNILETTTLAGTENSILIEKIRANEKIKIQEELLAEALAPNVCSGIPTESLDDITSLIVDVVHFSNFSSQSLYRKSSYSPERPSSYYYKDQVPWVDNRRFTRESFGTVRADRCEQVIGDFTRTYRINRKANPIHMNSIMSTRFANAFIPFFTHLNPDECVSNGNEYNVWSSSISTHLKSLNSGQSSVNSSAGVPTATYSRVLDATGSNGDSVFKLDENSLIDEKQSAQNSLANKFFNDVEDLVEAYGTNTVKSWEEEMHRTNCANESRLKAEFEAEFGMHNSIMFRTYKKMQKESWDAYNNFVQQVALYKVISEELRISTDPDIDISNSDLYCLIYNQATLVMKDLYVLARTSNIDVKRLSKYFFDENEHYNLGPEYGELWMFSRNPMDYADMFWPDEKRFSSNFAPEKKDGKNTRHSRAFK